MNPCQRISLFAACILCGAAATAAELPTLAESAASVCKGSTKSEQLVSTAIERAKSASALNAIITLDESGAAAAAQAVDKSRVRRPLPSARRRADRRQGQHPGRRAPATAGTPALKAFVPKAERRWSSACAMPAPSSSAKTNMHELAFGISGFNPAFQTGPDIGVRNAYDAHARARAARRRAPARRSARASWPAAWAPTPAARCASRARSTAAPACGRRWAATPAPASRRSRTRATRPARWRWRWPTWSCSTA